MTATAGIKSDLYERDCLKYLLHAAGHGDGTIFTQNGPAQLTFCLFTADPRSTYTGAMPAIGAGGSLEPTPAEYSGYARYSTAPAATRTAAEWTIATAAGVTTATKANTAVTFPASAGGTGCTITYLGIAMIKAGVAYLLYAWAVSPSVVVGTGTAPTLNIGDLVTEER